MGPFRGQAFLWQPDTQFTALSIPWPETIHLWSQRTRTVWQLDTEYTNAVDAMIDAIQTHSISRVGRTEDTQRTTQIAPPNRNKTTSTMWNLPCKSPSCNVLSPDLSTPRRGNCRYRKARQLSRFRNKLLLSWRRQTDRRYFHHTPESPRWHRNSRQT